MRSALASALLTEAEGKRGLSHEDRDALLSDVSAALLTFRHDAAGAVEEELARRHRVVDGLDDAIAAMSMGMDEPPFASESRASAALRDGTFPILAGVIGSLLEMRVEAASKLDEVVTLGSTVRGAQFAPLEGSRLHGRLQSLVLHAAASWAELVDPSLAMRSGGPLTRFLDAVLADVLGDDRPSIATVADFMKKRGREEIRSARGVWTHQAS